MFDLCIALSRASREVDTTRAILLLKSFGAAISDIFAKKKTQPIMALQPFLDRVTRLDKAYDIFR